MGVEVSLKHIPVVNFSMQQNHVPVIREIIVRNTGDSDLEGIDVHVAFDPPFAELTDLHIDTLTAGGTAQLTDIPVHISTVFLSNLTERIAGQIKVDINWGGECLASQSYDISVLAFDQWGGLSVLPSMLAAFVTPNHPDISQIVRRASEILGNWTGSPSFDEYQTRDPNRVKMQMAAIYEAIAEQRIAYCTVPASFEDSGQRIRLCGDIMSGKLATCLDMALLYGSCLEAVGIHPLLVVVKGHAFSGGWLIDDSFTDSVNDDVSLLTKRTADGINEIILVETTCMNAGRTVIFDDAAHLANDKLKDSDQFILFVDVLRARNAQIRPLPLRVMRDDAFEIEEPAVADRNTDAPSAVSVTHTVTDVEHISVGKQTIWERKLLDLSLRNNLINTRITKNTLQLISVNVNILEDALAAGAEFQLLAKPSDWDNPLMSAGIYQTLNATDPVIELVKGELTQKRLYSYLGAEALQHTLTHLYRSSRLALEENGANTLYLAIGLLKWFETPASTRPRFAPILLLPIEIIRKSAATGYVIRSRDEETALNITLLEMLRQDFGITIGGLDPLPTDESGVDVPLILNVFRRAIMAQTGWDVEEQAIIGNFSFNKFIMWNDIHNNADKLARNKIVASLISGKTEWNDEETGGDDIELDEAYPVGSVALPIGADSSQFEAICAAVDQKSFILHGPPGTGKSQTITNIIANALYNGKKVLFVAEKMAALQVVQRRLDAIGLAPFCLELHSNKTKKSYILQQLKDTADVVKRKSNEAFRIKAEHINKLRRELNSYVKTLHKIYPAGLSLYDCFARYASVSYDGEQVKISQETLATLTPASVTDIESSIADYQAISKLCGTPSRHPLHGIGLSEYRSTIRTEALECLSTLASSITAYQPALRNLSSIFRYDFSALSCETLKALTGILRILLEAEIIPTELLKAAGNQVIFNNIEKAVHSGIERDEARDALLENYSEAILSWDFRQCENMWRESYAKWWLPRIMAQRKVRSQLKAYARGSVNPSADAVENIFTQLNKYSARQNELDNLDGELAPVLGGLWSRNKADWSKVENAAEAVSELNRLILMFTRDIVKAAEFKNIICQNLEYGCDAFRRLYADKLRSALNDGSAIVDKTEYVTELLNSRNISDIPLDNLRSTAHQWADNIDLLHDWATCNSQRNYILGLGVPELVYAVDSGNVSVDNITDCFAKSLYRAYAEYILASEPEMNAFHGVLFDEKIERFRELSKEFERLTREELFAKLASTLPALQKEAVQSSEVGILQRNIRNGGRGTSIRRLFEQIPDLLTRMCPCMLMSPISVAQYIDADRVPFDLVIFDEASQMPTSEAVGAIARGHNVIVVGDPKQMPPTNFFSTNTFDEDNADKEDMENILEDCLALTMPSKYLLWHYRSRHESLIAFSNVKYYDNKLLTFPSPDDLTTRIGWQHIEGVYDRGKTRQNRAEAVAIINEIERRLSDPRTAGQSIGVVTFNTNQQSLIEDLLNDLFSRKPELEATAMNLDEPIFIKNLENVQGDERDVILFSIGYGPDKEGKIALNFGPLNRDGGRRRLNVAVSRARYEMKVFSTLKAEQIDLNRTSAEGVADLKAFLEYAEKGRDYLTYSNAAGSKPDDALIESISEALAAQGYSVRTNIGCSGYKIDLAVVDPHEPDKYLIGILCDGYHYSAAKTANDRIVTQHSVLRQLGWRLYRVWSMDWWENPQKTIEKIVMAIENAAASVDEPPLKADKPLAEVDAAVLTEPVEEVEKYIIPYTQCQLQQENISADEFASGSYDSSIMDKISEVMTHEAPISKALLCKRIINSYGISRMGTRLSAHMDRLLAQMPYIKTGDDTVFYWNTDQNPDNYANYRPESSREPLDIAPEEIAVAVYRILEEQGAIPIDSIKREVGQIFNYTRVGDNVSASINRAIDYAISKNRIAIHNDRIKLVM